MLNKVSILILIGVLCLSSFAFLHTALTASEAPSVEWSKRYGTTRSQNGWDSVIQTGDGGFAIACTSDFGTGNDADERFWLVKTDSTGNVEWNKTYGEQREVGSTIVQTVEGGYAVVGDSIIGGYGNVWLVKTDSVGNMQWNKSYTEIGWATAWSMIQTNDGGFVIAGCKEYYDGWLMKTDANGTMIWSRSFVEINNTQLQSVVQTNDGGYIAAGATQFPPFSGKVNAYVVKTDSDGNLTWSTEFSRTAGNDYGRSIVQNSDGGYTIAGETDHWGNADFWLIKTDAAGNFLWDKTYGGTGWDGANSIVQTADGGYALAGRTNSFGAGGNDFWLVETDADGDMQWNETFGGAGNDVIGDVGSCVVQTLDGGYGLAGYTNSFSGDNSYQVWLIKLRGSGPKTWIVDDDGPADFSTIQEAINTAWDGDTIFVRNGTYYEKVTVSKAVSLIGESQINTIVDGFNVTYPFAVFSVNVSNVFISNFTIKSGGDWWAEGGIALTGSSGNHLVNNDISGSWGGIILQSSQNNSIFANHIHSIAHSAIYSLESSQNIFVGNDIDSNWQGIWLSNSYNNTLRANSISNNSYYGINLSYRDSINNTITENNIHGNQYGINLFVTENGNNYLYHNNIIDNLYQVYIEKEPSNNSWDSGYPWGGNYWSDYNGTDLSSGSHQNETGSDNIGDSHYVIDANNQDNNPLMKPYVPFENQTIYIRADGSIEPSGAPILRKGDLYNLTSNITSNVYGIDIEKDNIVVDGAGYTLQGTNSSNSVGTIMAGRTNVTIENINIQNYDSGIVLSSGSYNNSVSGNNVLNNGNGILLLSSSNNSISGNNVANNGYGIFLLASSYNNKFYHNNFVANTQQVSSASSANVWDDGYPSGGNYWSDCNSTDFYCGVYQNETGNDGIGDSPYVINSINLDNYPLMKPYSGSHDIGITFIVLSKTIVGKGYCMNSSSTAINYGEGTETFNTTLKANGTGVQTQNVTLSMRNSTTIPFVWNTTDFAYGNYTMSAVAQPILGEIDLTDNNRTCSYAVHVGVPGDVSSSVPGVYDQVCNMKDVAYMIILFNTRPNSPNWDPNADVNNDGTVNMKDIAISILNFNKHESD